MYDTFGDTLAEIEDSGLPSRQSKATGRQG